MNIKWITKLSSDDKSPTGFSNTLLSFKRELGKIGIRAQVIHQENVTAVQVADEAIIAFIADGFKNRATATIILDMCFGKEFVKLRITINSIFIPFIETEVVLYQISPELFSEILRLGIRCGLFDFADMHPGGNRIGCPWGIYWDSKISNSNSLRIAAQVDEHQSNAVQRVVRDCEKSIFPNELLMPQWLWHTSNPLIVDIPTIELEEYVRRCDKFLKNSKAESFGEIERIKTETTKAID